MESWKIGQGGERGDGGEKLRERLAFIPSSRSTEALIGLLDRGVCHGTEGPHPGLAWRLLVLRPFLGRSHPLKCRVRWQECLQRFKANSISSLSNSPEEVISIVERKGLSQLPLRF